jgi:hypothetical protein
MEEQWLRNIVDRLLHAARRVGFRFWEKRGQINARGGLGDTTPKYKIDPSCQFRARKTLSRVRLSKTTFLCFVDHLSCSKMPGQLTTCVPSQASNTFEDLSGISTDKFENPYDALLAACKDDPVREL